jgi:hypothetical protein|tara:strand:- start:50 stop:307 length:258 start_codon:yes stop_codon:yes gene_type:complete
MAVLHDGATYEEFVDYVTNLRGDVPEEELKELYERHLKLKGLTFDLKRGWKSVALAPDEQDLTNRQLENKVVSEAKAQGRNIARV